MSIQKIIAVQERSTVSLIKTVLFAAALLMTSVATDAFADGSISGRVTGSNAPGGLQGTVIQAFSLTNDDTGPITIATTDASGNYTGNVAAGTYVVLTQDTHGYINEIYNNLPCSAVCNITDDDIFTNAVVVANGAAITGINFVLDPGGRIRGHVSSSVAGNPPIAGIVVQFTDPSGEFPFTRGVTDASGNFITEGGTATGSVRAYTTSTLPYQDEIYDNIKFSSGDVTTGTAIAVTLAGGATGVNFILDPGGQISGTVRDASGAPVTNIQVTISGSTGDFLGDLFTDASGNYLTSGLPAGNYYVSTHTINSGLGLVDQLYNGVTCVSGHCNPTQMGTAIPVVVGATTPGINFTLSPGGMVSGTVTAAAGGAPISFAFVQFFTVSTTPGPTFGLTIFEGGAFVNSSGEYHAVLPPGTHFAVVSNPDFANQLYNGLACAGAIATGGIVCNITAGTPINVAAGATTENINFSLVPGGHFTGVVTATPGGAFLAGIPIQVFSSAGALLGTVNTVTVPNVVAGIYTLVGLPVGSYYVRTNTNQARINQLYNGVACVGCDVTTSGGTLVPVTANTVTQNINFALPVGGTISGTITNAVGGAPIPNVPVQVFSSTGVSMGTFNSNASGVYMTSGLPADTYYVRTAVAASVNLVNELYDNIPCASCVVTTGTAVVVSGALHAGVNFALLPKIAPIPNVVTRINTPIGVPITVASAAGAAGLTLTASSSNLALVPNANLAFSGAGGSRTLTIFPAANQRGATTITVGGSDSTGTASVSFVLLVGIPPRGDFDGDRKADITVYRPSDGNWFIRKSSTNYTTWDIHQWGQPGDLPVPGDYDGDGKIDVTVYRPSDGHWFVLKSSTNYTGWDVRQWGQTGDLPVPGDFDGDGKADITIYRPSDGNWFILKSTTNYTGWSIYQWGGSGDVPVPGDYDGDGRTDITVYRPSDGNWFIRKSSTNYTTWDVHQWGLTGDLPVPGDYDGDGKADVAVYRPSDGNWFILKSSTNSTAWDIRQWGGGGDVPVPDDFDGDGKADVAVYRPSDGNWFILKSSTNSTAWSVYQWGSPGDIPILKRP